MLTIHPVFYKLYTSQGRGRAALHGGLNPVDDLIAAHRAAHHSSRTLPIHRRLVVMLQVHSRGCSGHPAGGKRMRCWFLGWRWACCVRAPRCRLAL